MQQREQKQGQDQGEQQMWRLAFGSRQAGKEDPTTWRRQCSNTETRLPATEWQTSGSSDRRKQSRSQGSRTSLLPYIHMYGSSDVLWYDPAHTQIRFGGRVLDFRGWQALPLPVSSSAPRRGSPLLGISPNPGRAERVTVTSIGYLQIHVGTRICKFYPKRPRAQCPPSSHELLADLPLPDETEGV